MGLFDKLQDTMSGFGIDLPGQTQQNQQPTQNYSQQQTQQPVQQPVQQQPTHQEGMYDPQLEHLIDIALADGELTEKEKQVLFKRAESMGIDLDEFEMVLDARLYEHNKEAKAQSTIAAGGVAAPSSNKFGDIKKCPACNAIIQSFTTRCPECGYEFRNIETNSSFEQLYNMIVAIDNEKNNSFHITSIGKFLSDELADEKKAQKKASIIQHYPIPTTKEAILEFLTQAAPLAKVKGIFSTQSNEDRELAKAWHAKCTQIIMKAKFAMKDDKETLAEIAHIAKDLKINF